MDNSIQKVGLALGCSRADELLFEGWAARPERDAEIGAG